MDTQVSQCAACGRVDPPGGLTLSYAETLLICADALDCLDQWTCTDWCCTYVEPAPSVWHEVAIASTIGTLVSQSLIGDDTP